MTLMIDYCSTTFIGEFTKVCCKDKQIKEKFKKASRLSLSCECNLCAIYVGELKFEELYFGSGKAILFLSHSVSLSLCFLVLIIKHRVGSRYR